MKVAILIMVYIARSSCSTLTRLNGESALHVKVENGENKVQPSGGSFELDLSAFKKCPSADYGLPGGLINGNQIPWQFTTDKKLSLPKSFRTEGDVHLTICGFNFVFPASRVTYTDDSRDALGNRAYLMIDPSLLGTNMEYVETMDIDYREGVKYTYYLKLNNKMGKINKL